MGKDRWTTCFVSLLWAFPFLTPSRDRQREWIHDRAAASHHSPTEYLCEPFSTKHELMSRQHTASIHARLIPSQKQSIAVFQLHTERFMKGRFS